MLRKLVLLSTGSCIFTAFMNIANASAGGTTSTQLPDYRAIEPSTTEMKNLLPAPATAQAVAETTRSNLVSGTADLKFSGSASMRSKGLSERAYGSFGIPYTSVRVQDSSPVDGATNANRLSTTYPYRTVGRLDFNTPGGSGFCSASLIRRSVLVTAAHCVAGFGSQSWYSSWTFRPGYFGAPGATTAQIQPFGAWTMQDVRISTTWFNGTDTGSGSARNNDIAVFIVEKNNSNEFIGDVVGWMSYGWNNYSFTRSKKTGNLVTAATTTLGYPGLLDSGEIMQRADGPTYTTTIRRAKQLWQGNNFTGGSSGGPWIVNFGYATPDLSGGAVAGSAPAANIVIGVTSWGTSDPNAPKDNYSSQFGQNTQFPKAAYGIYGAGNIGALLESLCSGTPSGSSQTYAQLGYCS